MYYTQETMLKNRIEAINELHSFMNEKIDTIIDFVKTARFKVDNTLYEADKKIFNEIKKTDRKIRNCYLKVDEYSISIEFDTFYSISEFSVNYFKEYIYLFDKTNNREFDNCRKKFPMLSYKDVIEAKEKVRELEIQADKIKSDISKLKYEFYLNS